MAMKPIIQISHRTYRSTSTVIVDGVKHERVKKIDAKIKEITFSGIPIHTVFSIDGKETITRVFGIPIKSVRRELWDHPA